VGPAGAGRGQLQSEDHLKPSGSASRTASVGYCGDQLPDPINFPVFELYTTLALNGHADWVIEEPELRQLYEQACAPYIGAAAGVDPPDGTDTPGQAYFLFLYNPLGLYAVNKAVEFVPETIPFLSLDYTSGDGAALVGTQAEGCVPE